MSFSINKASREVFSPFVSATDASKIADDQLIENINRLFRDLAERSLGSTAPGNEAYAQKFLKLENFTLFEDEPFTSPIKFFSTASDIFMSDHGVKINFSRFSLKILDNFCRLIEALNLNASDLMVLDVIGLRFFQLQQEIFQRLGEVSDEQKKAWKIELGREMSFFYQATIGLSKLVKQITSLGVNLPRKKKETFEDCKSRFEDHANRLFAQLEYLCEAMAKQGRIAELEAFKDTIDVLRAFVDKENFWVFLVDTRMLMLPLPLQSYQSLSDEICFEAVFNHFKYVETLFESWLSLYNASYIEKKQGPVVLSLMHKKRLQELQQFVQPLAREELIDFIRVNVMLKEMMSDFEKSCAKTDLMPMGLIKIRDFKQSLEVQIQSCGPSLAFQLMRLFLSDLNSTLDKTLLKKVDSALPIEQKSQLFIRRVFTHVKILASLVLIADQEASRDKIVPLRRFYERITDCFANEAYRAFSQAVSQNVMFHSPKDFREIAAAFLTQLVPLQEFFSNWQAWNLHNVLYESGTYSELQLIKYTSFLGSFLFLAHDVGVLAEKISCQSDEEILNPYLEFLVDFEEQMRKLGWEETDRVEEIVNTPDLEGDRFVQDLEPSGADEGSFHEPLIESIEPSTRDTSIKLPDEAGEGVSYQIAEPASSEDLMKQQAAVSSDAKQIDAKKKVKPEPAKGKERAIHDLPQPMDRSFLERLKKLSKEKKEAHITRQQLLKCKARKFLAFLRDQSFAENGRVRGSHVGFAHEELALQTTFAEHGESGPKKAVRSKIVDTVEEIGQRHFYW